MNGRLRILTCNIRVCEADDGENNWVRRKGLCAEVIRSRSPDIICFQEMRAEQFADLSSAFPEYGSYAMVDEPVGRHPVNCIFYRSDVFMRISAGGYWLSKRPHVAGSRSWRSACTRLANWLRLEDRASGSEFRVINTHLDHVSQIAREHQAQMIVEDARAYPDEYPQILTGDMNGDARNQAMASLKAGGWVDTYGAVHGTEDPGHTYHEFLGPRYRSKLGKIDWIFVRGAIKVIEAAIVTDSRGERFPSDHYFVEATVVVEEQDDNVEPSPPRTPGG